MATGAVWGKLQPHR